MVSDFAEVASQPPGRPSELHELIGAVVRLARDAADDTPVSAELHAQLEPLERRARAG